MIILLMKFIKPQKRLIQGNNSPTEHTRFHQKAFFVRSYQVKT